MSSTEMGLDAFLKHKTREFDGDGEFLRWKDRNKPTHVDVWLHTRSRFVQLFRCGFKRVVAVDDDGEKVRKVWSNRIVSAEPLEVLKRQSQRDRETGERLHPPTICPVSLCIEEVRRLIRDGKLELETPLFEFEGDEETEVIHAGGFAGMFKDKQLSDEEKKRLKKAGIFMKDAWKEDATAKSEWIFCVVDNENPDRGVQIAFEKQLLGEKLQTLIGNEIESAGRKKGNPLVNPYCIRWKNDPSQREFQKRYDVLILREEEMTDEVRELVCDGDPPDVSRFGQLPNYATLRKEFEEYCVVEELDLDKVFAPILELCDEGGNYVGPGESKKPAAKASGGARRSRRAASEDEGSDDDKEEKKEQKGSGRTRRRKKQEPEKPAAIKLDPCDECGAELTTDNAEPVGDGQIEITCPKCGAKFTDDAPNRPTPADDGDEIPF